MSYDVIVLAAGQGKRMNAGKNKVFLELDGIPLIIRTLDVFAKDLRCSRIILPINPTEQPLFEEMIAGYELEGRIEFTAGGKERQNSVFSGLQQIPREEGKIVLVHDGARPFVSSATIDALLAEVKESGGAIPGVRVKDTIKKVTDGRIEETVERANLWAVHTPQAFQYDILRKAHEQAEADSYLGTDDASLVERLGLPVSMVEDEYTNIKITTPEDLDVAMAICRRHK
ncbi:2-C-methyl-D-erythritol 4-phosphate cytidylyltransferase [Bacillus sp. 1P06AnD]|uniref:2-C-methyl-D-erythritol 4-phosphate cytidylyltransferase n=1 Tax=Bacillus sp. 1P06AnD TaxID=3132208 RepID=UPI00399F846B